MHEVARPSFDRVLDLALLSGWCRTDEATLCQSGHVNWGHLAAHRARVASAIEQREALGDDNGTYWAALQALKGDGYIPDDVSVNTPIGNVSGKARRELGTWPSPEKVVGELVAALEAAADAERSRSGSKRCRAP